MVTHPRPSCYDTKRTLSGLLAREKAGEPLTPFEQERLVRLRAAWARHQAKMKAAATRVLYQFAELVVIEGLSYKKAAERLGKNELTFRNRRNYYRDAWLEALEHYRRLSTEEMEAARQRLRAKLTLTADEAAEAWAETIRGERVGDVPPAVRYKAARELVDRLDPQTKQTQVTHTLDSKAVALIAARARQRQLETERQAELPAGEDDVVDAEVVEP